MFLVDIEYLVDIEIVEKHTSNHRSWLDIEVEKGHILCAGPKVPRTGGVIIAIANSKPEVEELWHPLT